VTATVVTVMVVTGVIVVIVSYVAIVKLLEGGAIIGCGKFRQLRNRRRHLRSGQTTSGTTQVRAEMVGANMEPTISTSDHIVWLDGRTQAAIATIIRGNPEHSQRFCSPTECMFLNRTAGTTAAMMRDDVVKPPVEKEGGASTGM
jgi:hypothetical protein